MADISEIIKRFFGQRGEETPAVEPIPPGMISISYHTQFITDDRSEAEELFFTACNRYIDDNLTEDCEIELHQNRPLPPIPETVDKYVDCIHRTLKVAEWILWSRDLVNYADNEFAHGRINEAIHKEIIGFIHSQERELINPTAEELRIREDYKPGGPETKDETTRIIFNKIENRGLSETTKDLINERLLEYRDPLNQYDDIIRRVIAGKVIEHWSQNTEFTHKKPILQSQNDKIIFTYAASYAMYALVLYRRSNEYSNPDNVGYIALNAFSELAERLNTYEKSILTGSVIGLGSTSAKLDAIRAADEAAVASRRQTEVTAREAQRQAEVAAREEQRRKAATALAIQRQADEAARKAKLDTEPRPYKLNEQAAKIRTQLLNYPISNPANAATARMLAEIIDTAVTGFDMRGDCVKELGDYLFSADNLILAARAFGVGNPFTGREVAVMGAAERLKTLCEKQGAKEKLDALLKDKEGIIFPALLTHDETKCKLYANAIMDDRKACAPIQKRINMLTTELAAFKSELSEDELLELHQEIVTEYTEPLEHAGEALKAAHATLDAKRATYAEEAEVIIKGDGNGKKKEKTKRINDDRTTSDSELSSALHVMLDKETGNFIYEPSNDPKYITIRSILYPNITIEVKRTADENKVAEVLVQLRADENAYLGNAHTIQDLIGNGFEVKKDHLIHPEYGITVAFEDKEEKLVRDTELAIHLEDAETLFNDRLSKQQSMLESAREVGIQIGGITEESQTRGPITLDNTVIAPRGYLDEAAFAVLQSRMDELVAASYRPAAPEDDIVAVASNEYRPWWNPTPTETPIIFDTSTLFTLSAQRGDGNSLRTWLDIIKQTARLPNVKIIIPAVVAAELEGRIPTFDDEGNRTGYAEMDDRLHNPSHRFHPVAAQINRFLQSASYAELNENGEVDNFQAGANSNILVVGTPGDKELYGRIHEILRESRNGARQRRLKDEIYKKGEGEKAINRIIRCLPAGVSPAIVSDDENYLDGKRVRNITTGQVTVVNDNEIAPRTTSHGMPVAHVLTGGYLGAEIRARGTKLSQLLNDPMAITLDRVSRETYDHQENIKPGSGCPMRIISRCGESTAGTRALSIDEIIKTGWNAMQQDAPANGTGPKSKKSTTPNGPATIVNAGENGRRARPPSSEAELGA